MIRHKLLSTLIPALVVLLAGYVPAARATGPSAPALAQKQVSYNSISFTYDTSLATSVVGTTIPAQSDPNAPIWEIGPQHMEFQFTGYVNKIEDYPQTMEVYPASQYESMNNLVPNQLSALRSVLASRPNLQSKYPLYLIERNESQRVPFLPPANAAIVLTAKMSYINLRNGTGIRYVLFGEQSCAPIDPKYLSYTVQALANNGKDLVTGFFTVSSLRDLGTPPSPPSGQECQVFDQYNQTLAQKIEQLGPADFLPNLNTLDQIFTSMSTVPLPTSYTFPQTNITVSGRFWDVWQGGRSFDDSLYINGLPITPARAEVSPTDGKTYQTQWFERARFEMHPENQPPYDVLLGLLGNVAGEQVYQGEGPFRPVGGAQGPGLQFFPQTGHTLGSNDAGGQAIIRFWTNLGGLQQFGYPISEPFIETSKDDGKQYLVQYFERQRFEYHPEFKGTRYEVLLGRLGAEQVGK